MFYKCKDCFFFMNGWVCKESPLGRITDAENEACVDFLYKEILNDE